MKTVRNSIGIWKTEHGETFACEISIGPCPHCLGYELVVSDVAVQGRASDEYPLAVHCGECGARGPWGRTDEEAVRRWNNAMNVKTEARTEWQLIPRTEGGVSDDEPF